MEIAWKRRAGCVKTARPARSPGMAESSAADRRLAGSLAAAAVMMMPGRDLQLGTAGLLVPGTRDGVEVRMNLKAVPRVARRRAPP